MAGEEYFEKTEPPKKSRLRPEHVKQIAKNPNTHPDILHKLSQDEDPDVRSAVAENPNTHPDILHALHQDEDPDIRYGVARNPSTHPDILHKLSQDENSDAKYGVARNPNTHPDTLHALHQDGHFYVRQAVAINSSTHPNTLHALHQDEDPYVRQAVAENPSTHPDILHKLHRDKNSDVRYGVARNPSTHPDILHKLHRDKNSDVRSAVAKNPSAHPDILHKLSQDGDGSVRQAVAENPNTHPDTLHALHQDGDPYVRQAVAINPNTHPDTLHKLSQDGYFYIRQAAARHPNTHPDTLHKLSQDGYFYIRQAAARHPNTHPDILHALHQDGNPDVRQAVAENPNYKPMGKSEKLDKAKLEHYSSQQGLKTIDPKFKGRGVDIRTKGRDTEHPHSFFYRAGTLPEDIVASGAKSKYTVEIPDNAPLYDLATDNQGHIASAIEQNQGALNMDVVHQNLKDAGYRGFYNSAHPQLSNVVALYHEHPVSEEHEVQKQEGTDCDDHLDPLKKPYASEAQRRWAHTSAGKKALGGTKAVEHWDTASRGKDLPEKVKKKDLNLNSLQKVSREEVAQSHILMFPVSINGQHKDEHENIPDYHITLKWMGNNPHKTPEEIQNIVEKHGVMLPESFDLHPHIFNTPNGPAHVLLLNGNLDSLHNAKREIDIGNPDRYPSYLPHITVSKKIHDAVKEHGLTAKDLNIRVHPLEYRVGEQTIKKYD